MFFLVPISTYYELNEAMQTKIYCLTSKWNVDREGQTFAFLTNFDKYPILHCNNHRIALRLGRKFGLHLESPMLH